MRELTKVVFNLNDFSVVDASSNVFETNESSSIVPISVEDVNGEVTILNKTSEEKKAEREAKRKESEARQREIDRRKKEKRSKTKKEENKEESDIYKDMF